MELHRLRYFVAVAEELHFTRAAARLHVAQPALSAQIRRLEAEVGSPLLERTTRSVALTPAGESLIGHARELIEAHDAALAAARSAQHARPDEPVSTLLVGISEGGIGALTSPVLERYRAAHPSVRLITKALTQSQQHAALRSGHIDLLLTTSMPHLDEHRFTALVEQPAVLALSTRHPLADAQSADVGLLLDEVIQPNDRSPDVSQDIFSFAAARNGEPARHAPGPQARNLPELLAGVRDGRWTSFGWMSALETWTPDAFGYRALTVTGIASPYRMAAIALKSSRNPHIAEFESLALKSSEALLHLIPGGRLPRDPDRTLPMPV